MVGLSLADHFASCTFPLKESKTRERESLDCRTATTIVDRRPKAL
jgi:hypothetical protein